ncbi:hypothetical protein [Burkholderia lata]|uniref:hypothetical protein n=1 Tax=Burkholderia lata (strain ATCC 17760 / DSM 23089 / LMG 22485 / NCIMB 9086 / R18194 / 383) TaxID=482957 RepID=UPI001582AE73|nr:hypothetical protein [Burkholderia lata]
MRIAKPAQGVAFSMRPGSTSMDRFTMRDATTICARNNIHHRRRQQPGWHRIDGAAIENISNIN